MDMWKVGKSSSGKSSGAMQEKALKARKGIRCQNIRNSWRVLKGANQMLTILLPFVIICSFRGVFWGDVRTDGGFFTPWITGAMILFNKVLYQASALIMVLGRLPSLLQEFGISHPKHDAPTHLTLCAEDTWEAANAGGVPWLPP